MEAKIGFIGAGKLGSSLALAMANSGYKINLINSSNNSSSKKLSGILPQCQSTSKAQEIADKCELILSLIHISEPTRPY